MASRPLLEEVSCISSFQATCFQTPEPSLSLFYCIRPSLWAHARQTPKSHTINLEMVGPRTPHASLQEACTQCTDPFLQC